MATPKQARFVTVEGSEGAGKSTNIQVLNEVLDARNIPYHNTREPGGTSLAEDLREIVLQPRDEEVDDLTELLLIFAARRQHVKNIIQPRLANGEWVVCDRFTDASYAYQGAARGLDRGIIDTLRDWVQEGLEPDLTLYFDVSPEIGAERIANREHDRLEREQYEFFKAVREGYLDLAREQPRINIIDASAELDAVQASVRTLFERYVDSALVQGSGS
ncbi:MAG: dTMP kinase [Pseudomonadales bacterium]|nr:dTMP kinase [Pseudomonadales bacterium]